MMDQNNEKGSFNNLRGAFVASQQTFEAAKKKNLEESRQKTSYFRMAEDGTYSLRILPIPPVMGPDGTYQMPDREGYEYPGHSLMLKIENPDKLDKKGNPTISYYTVPKCKYALKDVQEDPIDAYLRVACAKYPNDQALIKKLQEGSFSGGLRWDYKHTMYIINLDKPSDGLQIFQISHSQYKEIESRKLQIWEKLRKKNPNALCPLSSLDEAYPLEIVRGKSEGGKTEYKINIDTLADVRELSDENLEALLKATPIPEVIYKYRRAHMEATMVYLRQLDEKFNIAVFDEPDVQNAFEQVKACLPADDDSHFTMGGNSGNASAASATEEIDVLWGEYDAIADFDDNSEVGIEFRGKLRDFMEKYDIVIEDVRKKSNKELINIIEDMVSNKINGEKAEEFEEAAEEEPATEPEPQPETKPDPAPAQDARARIQERRRARAETRR